MGSWLKRGAAAQQLAVNAAKEANKASGGTPFRFFIKEPGGEAPITFVDGDLTDDGVLDPPRYYEHHVNLNGKWGNFILCKQHTSPEDNHVCPICEGGDKPALVALFTIIDHRSTTKDGKTYKDQTRILAAKPQTYELLQKLAKKRGGLSGVRFDAMRSNDKKSPAVGSTFDFIEKNDPTELYEKYKYSYERTDGTKVMGSNFTVADYDKAVLVKTEEELRAMGFGAGGAASTPSTGDTTNYSNEM